MKRIFILEVEKVEKYPSDHPNTEYFYGLHFTLTKDLVTPRATAKDFYLFVYNDFWLEKHKWLLKFKGKLIYKGDLDGNPPTDLALANFDYDFTLKKIDPGLEKYFEEQKEQALAAEREITSKTGQVEIIKQKDRIIKELKSKLKKKEQENQNYLVRIRELKEQNILLQQKLDTEKVIQEITTSLENQNLLEENPR